MNIRVDKKILQDFEELGVIREFGTGRTREKSPCGRFSTRATSIRNPKICPPRDIDGARRGDSESVFARIVARF